jgi:hypothetical protein
MNIRSLQFVSRRNVMWLYDLSCPERTPEGRFLGFLYYETDTLGVFNRDQQYGHPHDGGVHSLELDVTREDLNAFLAIIAEEFLTSRWGNEARAFVNEAMKRADDEDVRREHLRLRRDR